MPTSAQYIKWPLGLTLGIAAIAGAMMLALIELVPNAISPEQIGEMRSAVITVGVAFIIVIIVGVSIVVNVIYRQAENKELAYNLLFDSTPVAMWVYDLDTFKFLRVNEAAVSLYGYSKEEFYKMDIFKVRPLEERHKVVEVIKTMVPGVKKAGVWVHQTKAGDAIKVNVTSWSTTFDNRRARFVICEEVTKKLSDATKLVQTSYTLNDLFEGISEGLILGGSDGKLIKWNSACYTILNSNPDEMAQADFTKDLDLGHPDQIVSSILQSGVNSKSRSWLHYSQKANKWLNLSLYPVGLGVALYIKDVSADQERSMQDKKYLKDIEEMAWLISHKLRRPVASLIGITDLLEQPNAEEEFQKMLISKLRPLSSEIDLVLSEVSQRTYTLNRVRTGLEHEDPIHSDFFVPYTGSTDL